MGTTRDIFALTLSAVLLPLLFLFQTENHSSNGIRAGQLGNSFCYAFLSQGNLFVRCNGALIQITKQGNVNDYAISQTGTAMVLMRKKGTRELNNGFGTPMMTLQIIPMGIGSEERDVTIGTEFGGLAASCGTALFLYRTTKDLVSDRDIEFEPYMDFRCSSNRQEIAGEVELDPDGNIANGLLTGNDHSALVTGLPPDIKSPLVPSSGAETFAYDVSPNGKYIAYNIPYELCLVGKGLAKQCTVKTHVVGRISVSNLGDIFFATQTGGTCYYKDSFHVLRGHHPGYDERGACIAIAVLQKGNRSPDIIEPLAWYPQWLTTDAASALARKGSSNVH
jgi:hypothetical protein